MSFNTTTHSRGFAALGINLSSVRNSATTCPKCSASRKKSSDRCMKINPNGWFRCFHCGFTGRADSDEWIDGGGKPTEYSFVVQTLNKPTTRTYKKAPELPGVISDEGREYLKTRGLTDEVIDRNKIITKGDFVAFQYFVGGEVITRKYRGIKEKSFRFDAETKPVMYKVNDLVGKEFAIITEGEIDALSFEVIGVKEAVSIDKGAPEPGSDVVNRLTCIDNSINFLKDKKEFYISVDNDTNGKYLQEILINRFGRDKCRIVIYPDGCKDANEVLVKLGADALAECLMNAKEPAIKDIQRAADCWDEIEADFHNGEERGESCCVSEMEQNFSWVRTFMYCWSGMPNHGKSEFVKYLMILKSVNDGDVWAIFSPEHSPAKQFYKEIIKTLSGKIIAKDNPHSVTLEELRACREWVDKHFIFVYPVDQDSDAMQTPAWIVDKISELAMSRGVTGFLIDPWNQLDHIQKDMSREDLYLSHWFKKLKTLSQRHSLLCNVVTHPKSMQMVSDGKKLTWYDISGGAMWANKFDVITFISRPNFFSNKDCRRVEVDIQKAKQQHIFGKPALLNFFFNPVKSWYFGSEGERYSDMEGAFQKATGKLLSPIPGLGTNTNPAFDAFVASLPQSDGYYDDAPF